MIEIGKKYRLKKLKGWFEKDSEEFTVVCFGEHNIVGCVAPDGERYVFDKPNTCTYTTKNLWQRLECNSDFHAGFFFIGKSNTTGIKSGLMSNTTKTVSVKSFWNSPEK